MTFRSAGCSLLRAVGTLDVLHGGLKIRKIAVLDLKFDFFSCKTLNFLFLKPWIRI